MIERVESRKVAWRLDQLEHVACLLMSRMYQHSYDKRSVHAKALGKARLM